MTPELGLDRQGDSALTREPIRHFAHIREERYNVTIRNQRLEPPETFPAKRAPGPRSSRRKIRRYYFMQQHRPGSFL
jgi:hypothetical protein